MKALWKVKLTEPVRGGGKHIQNVFVVSAHDGKDAVTTVRRDSPSAFEYNPAIEVEKLDHDSFHVMSGRVKLDKVTIARLFPMRRG